MDSFVVNALQVNFDSVLSMEDAGIVRMFNSLAKSGLRGFLGVPGSVFEEALNQFFANATVIAGTIVSTMENRKMVITQVVFAEAFHLPTEGHKKKDMKVEYRLLHYIVAKSLSAKAGSFDVVTTERFDMMVAISIGLKVNWTHVLFRTLVAMVSSHGNQSQGFSVQLSILLEKLVKADLGESMALHPLKVLNTKLVHTYLKKNQDAPTSGEESKASGDKAVEAAKPKQKKLTQKTLAAGSSVAPSQSCYETSSDADERPLAKLVAAKPGVQAFKRKLIITPSDSESTGSLGLPEIRNKQRTKRTKLVKPISTIHILAEVEKAESTDLPLQVQPSIDQAGQQSTISGIVMVFPPVEFREINWANHFLPKIDSAAKGKEILEAFAWTNPVEEHCLLVIQSAWEAVSTKMTSFDSWARFRTEVQGSWLMDISMSEVLGGSWWSIGDDKLARSWLDQDLTCGRTVSHVVGGLPDSGASFVRWGARLGLWLVPMEPDGPGCGPVGRDPARVAEAEWSTCVCGGWSRRHRGGNCKTSMTGLENFDG
ncbi:hypothetical protein F511_39251 [Dorcoceras hygrometricum]|uniref:Uncharacterized protein n=1 Tax=Dorcoceras hygrometricum TaxID=472368 RepID=A0A2Z7C6Z7_9LAMI|nr:hypothetical protein F511_39251 [Dorcoceras hygrometricum]